MQLVFGFVEQPPFLTLHSSISTSQFFPLKPVQPSRRRFLFLRLQKYPFAKLDTILETKLRRRVVTNLAGALIGSRESSASPSVLAGLRRALVVLHPAASENSSESPVPCARAPPLLCLNIHDIRALHVLQMFWFDLEEAGYNAIVRGCVIRI